MADLFLFLFPGSGALDAAAIPCSSSSPAFRSRLLLENSWLE
jgi:hypothetical protein